MEDAAMQILQQMMKPPALMACRKVLCVQPHPDDNEIGMGGIVAALTAAGATVDYLTITDGALGDQGLTPKGADLKTIRHAEALAAAEMLGVHESFFMDRPDAGLNDVPSLADAIAGYLRAGGYDAVCGPDPWTVYEAHWDHIVAGRAVAYAAEKVGTLGGSEGSSEGLAAVGFYFTGRPNTVVDITTHFPLKMQAIAAHASQISAEMLQLYTGYFVYRGQLMTGSEAIGEGLKVLAPLHLHCIPEAADI